MKVILKVTSVSKLTDDKLLVQLQGKYGHSSLMVPIAQQAFVSVGRQFILGDEKPLQSIGELDETEETLPESLSPMISPMNKPRSIKLED
jgi:hypothetical protein